MLHPLLGSRVASPYIYLLHSALAKTSPRAAVLLRRPQLPARLAPPRPTASSATPGRPPARIQGNGTAPRMVASSGGAAVVVPRHSNNKERARETRKEKEEGR